MLKKYPDELESWWVHYAESKLKKPIESALEELSRPIQNLSDLFTKNRPQRFQNYIRDAHSLLAYGLFYFPQAFIRSRFPIAEVIQARNWSFLVPQEGQNAFENHNRFIGKDALTILDLGAGLGGNGLGIATFLSNLYPEARIVLYAVDHSEESLDTLLKLYTERIDWWPHLKVIPHKKNIRGYKPSTHFDLITFGFSFNEAFSEETLNQKKHYLIQLSEFLKPHGLIYLLEPALQKTALALQELVDAIILEEELYSWGPYLHSGPCPLREEGKFWNHEVRNWQPPSSLKFLNRTLWRSIETLKFSYALLGKVRPPILPPSPHHFRLCSPLSHQKGRFLFAGVATNGKKYTYDLQTRNFSSAEINALHAIERGDILKVSRLEPLQGEGCFRIVNVEDILEHYSPDGHKALVL